MIKEILSFFSDPQSHENCSQEPQMKRGFIRMAAGAVLLFLQVLSIVASPKNTAHIKLGPGYYLGLYGPGIIGLALLVFGILAYRKGMYSKLVLHREEGKFAKVMKWVGFGISALLLLAYFFSNMRYLNFDTLLPLFGTVAFCVYTLEYLYKKPSCLFSATLILIGATYLYSLISNAYFYTLYVTMPFVVMGIIPQFLAALLYIAVASIVYMEKFSPLVVKILGWTILALELSHRVGYSLVMTYSIFFRNPAELLELLFVVVLVLYMSILKIDTLKDGKT